MTHEDYRSSNLFADPLITRFDIETVTLGVSLRDCSSRLVATACARIYDRIRRYAGHLATSVDEAENRFGVSVQNVCVAVTPVSTLFDGLATADYTAIAETLDRAAKDIDISRVAGFTALCSKGMTAGDAAMIRGIPHLIASTERVCASVECAGSRRGINGNVVKEVSRMLADSLNTSRTQSGQLPVALLANASGSSPYAPGAFHGIDEPEVAMRISVSGSNALAELARYDDPPEPASATAERIQTLRRRLARGARLVGDGIARSLAQRSGLDVRLDRIEISPDDVRAPRRLAGTGPGANTGAFVVDLARSLPLPTEFGSASAYATAPICRRWLLIDSGSTADDIAGLLTHHLADAASTSRETEIGLLPDSDG